MGLARARFVAATATAVALVAMSAAASASGMEGVVDALSSETEECSFLVALCRVARTSIDRAEGTPPEAELPSTRQALLADARVQDAVDAADLIERKRGHRLACFDVEPCVGIVPNARSRPEPKTRVDHPPR